MREQDREWMEPPPPGAGPRGKVLLADIGGPEGDREDRHPRGSACPACAGLGVAVVNAGAPQPCPRCRADA